jgi:hypothetical protein
MQKSLFEFVSLPEAELIRTLENGPLLLTQNEEPRFVAQPIDQFETMVRRLRTLESLQQQKRERQLARVIPLPKPFRA